MDTFEPPEEPHAWRTLRGFMTGEEPDEENYFHFSATLRIFGDDLPLEEISTRLGVQPTTFYRKGERRPSSKTAYQTDAWMFQAQVPQTELLGCHIEALWRVVQPEVAYLKSLKERFGLDVFCGYRSNCDHAGFEVDHKALELFTALEIPFGVSVIII